MGEGKDLNASGKLDFSKVQMASVPVSKASQVGSVLTGTVTKVVCGFRSTGKSTWWLTNYGFVMLVH